MKSQNHNFFQILTSFHFKKLRLFIRQSPPRISAPLLPHNKKVDIDRIQQMPVENLKHLLTEKNVCFDKHVCDNDNFKQRIKHCSGEKSGYEQTVSEKLRERFERGYSRSAVRKIASFNPMVGLRSEGVRTGEDNPGSNAFIKSNSSANSQISLASENKDRLSSLPVLKPPSGRMSYKPPSMKNFESDYREVLVKRGGVSGP